MGARNKRCAAGGRRSRAALGVWLAGSMLGSASCGSSSAAAYCAQLERCGEIESYRYLNRDKCLAENQQTIDCLDSSGRSQACARAYEEYLSCMAENECIELRRRDVAHCEEASASFSENCQSVPERCSFHDSGDG
ncbi:MAG: hypothetical protein JXR83_05215 [Deltaproteobacteria bacterium]|nr:hypothetical protein [Deltaproteobacteria bacterium]